MAATAALGPAPDTPIIIRIATPMATAADQARTRVAWSGETLRSHVRTRVAAPGAIWARGLGAESSEEVSPVIQSSSGSRASSAVTKVYFSY
jgi:hypothetical protein